MSKSLGNVIAPEDVMRKYGADVLRLWVASADYRGDLRVSDEILDQIAEVYRRIRNTARFLLGNLYDFDPARHRVPYEALPELERWALARTGRLMQRVRQAYEDYEFHVAYHALNNFCTVDLSGFYLDVRKDCLYCDPADAPSRRAAQTVLLEVLLALTRLVAPILVFTADEIWEHLPEAARDAESVHLSRWPEVPAAWLDEALEERWERLLAVRRTVARALERARAQKLIGGSNEAAVLLAADPDTGAFLASFGEGALAEAFLVSQVRLGAAGHGDAAQRAVEVEGDLRVTVVRAPGEKCERCWRYAPGVGEHAEHPTICHRCAAAVTLASAAR